MSNTHKLNEYQKLDLDSDKSLQWLAAQFVLRTLEAHNFAAYLVGGFVRDKIIELEQQKQGGEFSERDIQRDIDIATSATPEEVIKIFDKTIPSGLKYGTVTVCVGSEDQFTFEVTTFRTDLNYSDGRRPENVIFSDSIDEDLKRRDFTMNAVAMDSTGKLVDTCSGVNDIVNKTIRCVGNPYERFTEDGLRMLRAVRFQSQLGFELDPVSFDAIQDIVREHRDQLAFDRVSCERVKIEIEKLIVGNYPAIGLRTLFKTGLMHVYLPELSPMVNFDQKHPAHSHDLFEHTIKVVELVDSTPALRWAALLHDVGKPHCQTFDKENVAHYYGHDKISADLSLNVASRFKFSKHLRDRVQILISSHMLRPLIQEKAIRRWIHKVGIDIAPLMAKFMEADALGTGSKIGLEYYKTLSDAIDKEIQNKPLSGRAALNIDGHALMNRFDLLKQEPKLLKFLLQDMVDFCVEEPSGNNYESLIEFANQWLKRH